MASEVFQISTLTRMLDENVGLAEALGFPKISSLDESERKWRSSLQTKARTILEDAELTPAITSAPARQAEFQGERTR